MSAANSMKAMNACEGGESSKGNPMAKTMERMQRLKQLHMKRNEGSRLNHQEVVEEYKKSQLPKNFLKKKEWAEMKLEEEKKREEAKEKGEDYDRLRFLEIPADEAEKYESKKNNKKNGELRFSDYETATLRLYNRSIKNFKPDLVEYDRLKEEIGEEAFYADSNTLIHGLRKDPKASVDRMVEDLNKQLDRKSRRVKKRILDDEEDIDYINERNMKFNKKLERFYGQYTTEIKQNLERGTAV
ncbi:pre-mRNA-splicing factor SYF2-like protein [Dinothrombium tinctorium]|uniref:Pre-mRNA-splicing factor SYF2 n=1 Tax=Dinothrombium tinctorium TaxID=1965070 RepID=A0A443RPB7_9ACAR|nr:pre-mRNA-splicing factor SYF2-like protein [Dinothrombium tinctorium]